MKQAEKYKADLSQTEAVQLLAAKFTKNSKHPRNAPITFLGCFAFLLSFAARSCTASTCDKSALYFPASFLFGDLI